MKMTSGRRALDKIYKRRDRYDIPDWQREEVWDIERKQELIDSILRGWKLPKFYFRILDEDEYEVVDGQQRLTAIYEFFDGELQLSDVTAAEFGGTHYKDLKTRVSDSFDDFEIEFDEIEEADDEELKQFFQRLQQGLPLTASERLNSVHSKLRDFCKETAQHEFFSSKVSFPDTRYAHFDVASKAAAIEIEGIDTGLRFESLRDTFKNHSNFSRTSAAAKRLDAAIGFLNKAFPSKSPLLKNRSAVQSLISLASRVVGTGRSKGKEKAMATFFKSFMTELTRQVELGPNATDLDYLRFQRSINANVRAGARIRQEVLLRKLFTLAPDLADVFDSSELLESGLGARISELAENIRTLIADANDIYSADNGEDFFKATSKTAQSLVRIGKPAKTLADYKQLVDDLYFLFREGPGSKLKDKWPPSFADVNTLRTEIRHDVDHGDGGKIRGKKKKAGKVFAQYAGVNSPQAADAARFALAQTNILTALENDLRGLVAGLAV